MNLKRAKQVLRCAGPHSEEHARRELKEALAEAERSPELAGAYANQLAFDRAAAGAVRVEVPPGVATALTGYGERFSERRPAFRLSVHNPAAVAVGAAFLVLVCLLAWIFLANAGGFAGMREVTELALAGGRAEAGQFDPLEAKASALGDWFVLEGFDGFRVPEELAEYGAVGVRLYRHEGEAVASAAVPIGGRRAFFYSFDAHPFGVSVTPEGAWRVAEFGPNDEFVLGIREVGAKCFVVSFRGTRGEMEALLGGGGGEGSAASP